MDKFYKVHGTLHWASGLGHLSGDVYCKIRVDNRTSRHRAKRMSPGKVVGKTAVLKIGGDVVNFDYPFEVDGGRGVAAEGIIIFDLKAKSNHHLATKGFSFKYLLGETEHNQPLQRHLAIEHGMEVELTMFHSEMNPSLIKKRTGMFKSRAFGRTEKSEKHE